MVLAQCSTLPAVITHRGLRESGFEVNAREDWNSILAPPSWFEHSTTIRPRSRPKRVEKLIQRSAHHSQLKLFTGMSRINPNLVMASQQEVSLIDILEHFSLDRFM